MNRIALILDRLPNVALKMIATSSPLAQEMATTVETMAATTAATMEATTAETMAVTTEATMEATTVATLAETKETPVEMEALLLPPLPLPLPRVLRTVTEMAKATATMAATMEAMVELPLPPPPLQVLRPQLLPPEDEEVADLAVADSAEEEGDSLLET